VSLSLDTDVLVAAHRFVEPHFQPLLELHSAIVMAC
jgi:hypothetical protein